MTMTSDNALADRARVVLQRLMREHGATQTQLADVLGMHQVAVSARVRGRTPLTLADIERLADFFGVAPDFFISVSESAWTRPGAGQRHLWLVAA